MEHAHMLKLHADARTALQQVRTQDRAIWTTLYDLEVRRLQRLIAWLRRETLRAPMQPTRSVCKSKVALHRKRLARARAEVQARTRPIWKHEQDVLFESHYVDLWKARLASAPKEERAPRARPGAPETKRRERPSPAALAVARIKTARLTRGSHAVR